MHFNELNVFLIGFGHFQMDLIKEKVFSESLRNKEFLN